jgi:hypothetical protein
MIRTTVAGDTATGPSPIATTTDTNVTPARSVSVGRRLHDRTTPTPDDALTGDVLGETITGCRIPA